eukprot:Nitzschia sp. Nitz4//scaffold16_size188269//54807//55820//NITZ4_001785-RA/size188269-processed-gene-0.51-mRNA-1//-1//CDS//3329538499//6780//frame0
MAATTSTPNRTQIPIVCPGHTRPLAELQYLLEPQEQRMLLLSACHDKLPMLRDGNSGDWIGTFQGHKGAVWSCQMDPQCNLAATASGDFSAQLWDAITGKALAELPHKHIVKACAFSPDSLVLATGGKEGLLRLFSLQAVLMSSEKKHSATLEIKQAAPITKVVWIHPQRVLVGCSDGKIYLWQVDEPAASSSSASTLLATFDTQQTQEIRDMEVSTTTSGQFLMTVAAGDKVYLWDLVSPTTTPPSLQASKVFSMPIHYRDEGGVSLHPSGTKFVTGGSDLWVRVFDVATGQELECHKGHHGPIRCVRYSPDGMLYATGSEDGTIRLWKTDFEEEA